MYVFALCLMLTFIGSTGIPIKIKWHLHADHVMINLLLLNHQYRLISLRIKLIYTTYYRVSNTTTDDFIFQILNDSEQIKSLKEN